MKILVKFWSTFWGNQMTDHDPNRPSPRTTPLGKGIYQDGGVHKKINQIGEPDIVAIDVRVELLYDPKAHKPGVITCTPWRYRLHLPNNPALSQFLVDVELIRHAGEKFYGTSGLHTKPETAKMAADKEAKDIIAWFDSYLQAKKQIKTYFITIPLTTKE